MRERLNNSVRLVTDWLDKNNSGIAIDSIESMSDELKHVNEILSDYRSETSNDLHKSIGDNIENIESNIRYLSTTVKIMNGELIDLRSEVVGLNKSLLWNR